MAELYGTSVVPCYVYVLLVHIYGFFQPMKDYAEVFAFYNNLQYVLYETGCLETIDRTPHPRTVSNAHGVHVCIFSAPRECMGILLEGRYM